MQKIYNYVFQISPKKLAVYLVLGPLLLFLAHTITTITFRVISDSSPPNQSFINIVSGTFFLLLGMLVLLWLFWLRSTVFSIAEAQLGLARKWFQIAYLILCFFVLFNLSAYLIEYLAEIGKWNGNNLHLIYAARELINFSGIIIAYPIVCLYAASAATLKRNTQQATFVHAIPFTLLLIFGTVLGIPFLHKYFSTKTSTNSEIVIIYSIAFGFCIILFIVGFIAAVTGLI